MQVIEQTEKTQSGTDSVDDRLIDLTLKKDVEAIKLFLQSLPETEKGPAFEWYLAELYRGNGWIASRVGGRQDSGADILLYHPKQSATVSIIVQAKNQAKRLSFDDTRIELIKFEEQYSKKYKCNQYNLISVSGFVKDAAKLSEFNLLLEDWSHVVKLINGYDPDNVHEPEIELFAHNRLTYGKVSNLWEKSKYVAVVQATGTGKSYIIAKVLSDFPKVKKLVLAPSNYIIDDIAKLASWTCDSTTFMTYAKTTFLTGEEIESLDAKLVVLDEFHRCGADEWGKGVQNILAAHSDAYVLGTSATPIRYLDNSRDMSDELFGGMVAENLSLAQAIVKKILPMPKYVSALYTLNEEIESLKETIEGCNKSEDEKRKILEEINLAKLDWETSSGIPEILKKHVTPDLNKFIVFCKDEEHLNRMEWIVHSWFEKAGIGRRRKTYRVLSREPESDEELERFRQDTSRDAIHLLLSINMLNEGLHVEGVSGVILLRPTESPIVFYQQIGRCIKVGVSHTPIIFDFVNNFRSIRARDFLDDLEEAKQSEIERRKSVGMKTIAQRFGIVDETRHITELFESIEERLQNWELHFSNLVKFKERFNHCNVPFHWEENPSLGRWVTKQRGVRNELSQDRVARLDELGFDWDPINTRWEQRFAELLAFRNQHGHCNVPQTWKENRGLAVWVMALRQRKHALTPEKIQRLDQIGFNWQPGRTMDDTMFNLMFDQLLHFREKNGHCIVPQIYPENRRLGRWVNTMRTNKQILPKDKLTRLNEVGFAWSAPHTKNEKIWQSRFTELAEYKRNHDDCNVPYGKTKYRRLGNWVNGLRMNKPKLSAEQIKQLDELDFEWNPIDGLWEKRIAELITYKQQFGNCNVPTDDSNFRQLGLWVNTQKTHQNYLLPERKRRLEEIGFDWENKSLEWDQFYEMLQRHRQETGSCTAPTDQTRNRKIWRWVRFQRKHKDSLTKNQIDKLNEIGFEWQPAFKRISSWDKMYLELVSFKQRFGHCNPPRQSKEFKKLSTWVFTQRQKPYRLTTERLAKLNSIGFDWHPRDTEWNKMFDQIKAFKELHGNCNVLDRPRENNRLGNWVRIQRHFKKNLSQEQISKLDSIGFEWSTRKHRSDKSFEKRIFELTEFRRRFGHCNVPRDWPENRSFSRWVRELRYNKPKLSDDRIKRIDELGFDWDTKQKKS